MDALLDDLVGPVANEEGLFHFRMDLAGKALVSEEDLAPYLAQLEEGDLLIGGYGAVWEGDDRQGENFVPGAFESGISRFLGGQSALCYNHDHSKVLGRVLDMREEGKGLFAVARVDGAIQQSPELKVIYDQIKRGTFNGMSSYGYFKRGTGDLANKIQHVDMVELSVTGMPVHPGTSMAVLAAKALQSDLDPKNVGFPAMPVEDDEHIRQDDWNTIQECISTLDWIFKKLNSRGSVDDSNNDGTSGY